MFRRGGDSGLSGRSACRSAFRRSAPRKPASRPTPEHGIRRDPRCPIVGLHRALSAAGGWTVPGFPERVGHRGVSFFSGLMALHAGVRRLTHSPYSTHSPVPPRLRDSSRLTADGRRAPVPRFSAPLMRQSYRVVPLDEIFRSLRDGIAPAPRTVAITFDDSYADTCRRPRCCRSTACRRRSSCRPTTSAPIASSPWDTHLPRLGNLTWGDVDRMVELGHDNRLAHGLARRHGEAVARGDPGRARPLQENDRGSASAGRFATSRIVRRRVPYPRRAASPDLRDRLRRLRLGGPRLRRTGNARPDPAPGGGSPTPEPAPHLESAHQPLVSTGSTLSSGASAARIRSKSVDGGALRAAVLAHSSLEPRFSSNPQERIIRLHAAGRRSRITSTSSHVG